MGWVVRIGQADDAAGIRTQARVVDVIVREEFAHVDFAVTVNKPTDAERQQDTGRIDSAVIEITRGSDDLIVGYIEGVERGIDYVKYTGRSFLVLLGYSTSGETDGTGDTKAEYDGDDGDTIATDLIGEFCLPKDAELVYTDITFTEVFGGEVKLHGKKVYQIVHDMCSMHGKDMWSTATWTGDNVTAKNIHIGTKSRGSSVSPNTTLTGGVQIANIPVIKYRTDVDMVNAIRVFGKGTGKDRITAYYTDGTSIGNYGTIEAEPFYSNMIADVDTALAVGQAIVDAKKEPIAQLMVEPAYYINDLLYGDWVRIIDSYSGIDVTKRIRKITRAYNNDSGESMEIELGEKFNNYENIVRELTKGDVDPEPEMTKQGGSFRITANTPPSDYIRYDPGDWYDTTGAFQTRGKGACPFWTYTINPATGTYKKALIQISNAGSVTYKVGTQYAAKGDAESESVSVDALNTPLGEVILKGKAVGGGGYTVEDVYDADEGDSYIYRDVRPIIGSSSTGYGGEPMWEIDGTETQLVTPDSIDMQGHDIIKIANLKGSLNSDFSLYGSNSGDTDWIEFLQWDHSTEQILINRNTDLYDASTISPELKFRVPLDEGYSGFYIDYHSVDGVLRFRNITGDTDVVTFSDTGRVNLIDDLWMTKGKEINFGTPNTAYIYQDAATNDLKFYDSVLAATKTLSELAGSAGLWEVDGTETQLITADDIDMQDFNIIGIGDLKPQNPAGIDVDNSAGTTRIYLGLTDYAFKAQANGDMSGNNLIMGAGKITGLAAGTANGDSIRYEQLIGAYLLLSGGTMAGNITMNDNNILSIGDMRPHNATGIDVDNSAGVTRIFLGLTSYSFKAQAPGDMSGNNLEMGSGDIIQAKNIKGLTTGTDGADRLNLDFRGDGTHRIWYTGVSDNRLKYETFSGHLFSINTADICQVSSTGLHMASGKYIKSDSGDLELRAPSGSKIKFVIG